MTMEEELITMEERYKCWIDLAAAELRMEV